MAAWQSLPLCTPLGLLLLLLIIGVISNHLPQVHARDIDFWCKNGARKMMMMMIGDKVECVGSDVLPSPMKLPCVGVHVAEWANKTLGEKRAEVLGALQVFQGGLQGVSSQVTLQCQTSLLQGLEQSVANYLAIVGRLHLQGDDLASSHSAVQNCSSETSLSNVLKQYRKLLVGKLDCFAVDLQDIICKQEHGTIHDGGP